MAPKPKIPPEYAKVAKKLSSEIKLNEVFDQGLEELSKGLKSNLDARSVPADTDAMQTVKAAGVFDKTTGTKTPDIGFGAGGDAKAKTILDVGLDELLGKTDGTPNAVEGTGVKEGVVPGGRPGSAHWDYNPKSGVLMDNGPLYTPERFEPTTTGYPLKDGAGYQKTEQVRDTNHDLNMFNRLSGNDLSKHQKSQVPGLDTHPSLV